MPVLRGLRDNSFMSVSADTLRTHIDYHAWATRRLIESLGELSPEELGRDFGTADRSVLDTLAHVYAADRLWLGRILEHPNPGFAGFITPADRSLSVLQNDWPSLLERWKQWGAGLTVETALEPLAYSDLKGGTRREPLWQIVFHVVNHGTHHRGQVSGFLRTMGRVPPWLDMIVYYREVG
jgi:uncharacterized damage-inducible protein DinB